VPLRFNDTLLASEYLVAVGTENRTACSMEDAADIANEHGA
jgi:hypothetical protein